MKQLIEDILTSLCYLTLGALIMWAALVLARHTAGV